MNRTILGWTILSISAIALNGCATAPERVCTQNCEVDIKFAGAKKPDAPPKVKPDVMTIAGGSQLTFEISDGDVGQGGVTLVFEEAIVRPGRRGPWLYTVDANPGRNSFYVRPLDAENNRCENPCKYVVINRGNPDHRSLINSPMVRIRR